MRARPALRRRLFLATFILAVIIALAGWLAYANTRANSEIAATAAARDKMIADMDQKIAALKKAKEETRLRKEAEAKKAAEEAARIAAEKERAKSSALMAAQPAPLSCATAPSALTVVINKKHCFSPLSWAPGGLSSVNGYPMRAEAASQMIAMMQAASTDGSPLDLSSAYRSYDNQQVTYNYWVSVNGSAAAADTVSARPGYSEHQTGLAADLKAGSCALECFGTTTQYQWLKAHAANYGYIERYPSGQSATTGYSPEPWHWRYVTPGIALAMKQSGALTLESYFGVSGGSY